MRFSIYVSYFFAVLYSVDYTAHTTFWEWKNSNLAKYDYRRIYMKYVTFMTFITFTPDAIEPIYT